MLQLIRYPRLVIHIPCVISDEKNIIGTYAAFKFEDRQAQGHPNERDGRSLLLPAGYTKSLPGIGVRAEYLRPPKHGMVIRRNKSPCVRRYFSRMLELFKIPTRITRYYPPLNHCKRYVTDSRMFVDMFLWRPRLLS